MPIMRDWQLTFDQAQFIQEYGHTYGRVLRRPGMSEILDATFREVAELVQPAVVWDLFPVQEMRHETVILSVALADGPAVNQPDGPADEEYIGNGPVTTVMGGAAQMAIAVCTVGQAISERIHAHREAGEVVSSMLLDQLGTLAVGQLCQQFYAWLKDDVCSRGLHISTYLSPGESEWSIEDQAVIFRLLDTVSIGVSLTESLLMMPVKSLSLMAGIGPQPMGAPGTTHCDYCTMKNKCLYRGKHA
jgi:hypothetical protein